MRARRPDAARVAGRTLAHVKSHHRITHAHAFLDAMKRTSTLIANATRVDAHFRAHAWVGVRGADLGGIGSVPDSILS
jgi:hypothetical protein